MLMRFPDVTKILELYANMAPLQRAKVTDHSIIFIMTISVFIITVMNSTENNFDEILLLYVPLTMVYIIIFFAACLIVTKFIK